MILKTERLAIVRDFNQAGYYVQFYGSDARAFFSKKDVRRAERSDVIRLQVRARQELLMPDKQELDPSRI